VFLPAIFTAEKFTDMVAAKVLTGYGNRDDITPAAKHAVDQLLLRLKYLNFDGTAADLAVRCGSSTTASDFVLDEDSLRDLQGIYVDPQKPGARPDPNIFDRPLLRRRAMRDRNGNYHRQNAGPAESFPNALQAVQELSFASNKVRHMDAIDDILIANNIVHSANGKKTESYNCIWMWQDDADLENLECQRSSETFAPAEGPDANAGFSILDIMCGLR